VCKARALAQCGAAYKHAAALLISEVLQKAPAHEEALLDYVKIVLELGHVKDAMRILLRLLVNQHRNSVVR
jgi:thioredoxin-like negative regulator of GroEL